MNQWEDELYWYWLSNIEGIGTKTITKLLTVYESPRKLYENLNSDKLAKLPISKKAKENLSKKQDMRRIETSFCRLQDKRIQFLTFESKDYPEKLRKIFNPPYCLYVRGKLPCNEVPTIAIVGARECSLYGKEMAIHFGKELAKAGVQIVSGLARGIDSYAHKGAIHEVGGTFGVLGSGIDICYPPENIELYMEMIQLGGVISEYNVGCQPFRSNFPMRNRIISGLSDGVLLIEARRKSGSLITVDLGLGDGRNIYAIPGRITDELSGGTNDIIAQGGKLVTSPEDILIDYSYNDTNNGKTSKKINIFLETDEKMVYDRLSLLPKHMEEIMKETGFSATKLSEVLLNLLVKGYIKQTYGNYYSILS